MPWRRILLELCTQPQACYIGLSVGAIIIDLTDGNDCILICDRVFQVISKCRLSQRAPDSTCNQLEQLLVGSSITLNDARTIRMFSLSARPHPPFLYPTSHNATATRRSSPAMALRGKSDPSRQLVPADINHRVARSRWLFLGINSFFQKFENHKVNPFIPSTTDHIATASSSLMQ